MTEQQLAEIEQRWAKATPGPWKHEDRPGAEQAIVALTMDDENQRNHVEFTYKKGTRETILITPWVQFAYEEYTERMKNTCDAVANAPTDVQALLAEVRRLNRMVDRAVEMLHAEIDCPNQLSSMIAECEINSSDCDCVKCWRRYLESEVAE